MTESTMSLIERLGRNEAARKRFVAPRAGQGCVRTRVEGLVQSLLAQPRGYEGWAVFQNIGDGLAVARRAARPSEIESYLKLCRVARLILVRPLQGRGWLAWPAGVEAFSRRFGAPRPVVVQLVSEASAFETVVARFDGANFWFERPDPSVHPRVGRGLRGAMERFVDPDELRITSLTPEAREAYSMALNHRLAAAPTTEGPSDTDRVTEALRVGGGRLTGLSARNDYWLVEWTDRNGQAQSSAISKDLQVISAGICLDERDADFDLQSLVGVVSASDMY